MSFQSVDQAGGQQVSMSGAFIEVGGTQFTTNQKAKAICKIRDTVGTSHNVHIYKGKGELPTQLNVGLIYQFNLSTFQGKYQNKPYTGYSGFWNDPAQDGQNTPQDSPQASQNAPQSTKPPQTQSNQSNAPAWQALDREFVQKDVICALLASRKRPEPNEVKIWTDYIMDGIHPDSKSQDNTNPEHSDNPPRKDEDGIPF